MNLTRTLLIPAILTAAVLAQGGGEVALRTAIETETVKGDIKNALRQYSDIAAKYARSDRATAASALMHLAECREKMGDPEARRIYERVIREYADQKDAVAEAKVRLGATGTRGGALITRQIWMGPNVDVYGSVSPDGRLITFYDKQSGDLAVHDVLTGEDRRLTHKGPQPQPEEYGQASAFSPDGKQVAYAWLNKEGRYDLRVIGVSPANSPRILCDNAEIDWIVPYDWSHDGKWIAVEVQRPDRTAQIGLVSATDGSLRILRSIDWRGSSRLAFSPDGGYLAFDLPAGEGSGQRDVFVLAIDGSSQAPAVTGSGEALVVGWSPDGKALIFASDRTGKTAVYAMPIEKGKRSGEDKLLNSDIGQSEVMGLLRNGTLYYGIRIGSRGFYTASVDFQSGRLLTAATSAAQKYLGTNYEPAWSPDGSYLSYQSYGGQRRGVHLVIRSLDSGQTRELWPNLSQFNFARWSSDGKSLLVSAADLKGRAGIYRIDAQTGNTELVLASPPGQLIIYPSPSPDGKKIYYLRGKEGRFAPKPLIEYDIASATERELMPSRCTGNLSVSFSGALIACSTIDPATKEPAIWIVPTNGSTPRELLRLHAEDALGVTFTAWTRDDLSIVFPKGGEVWIAALAGGSPRKMEIDRGPVLDLRVHPNGRQIAFTTRNKGTQEVRAAEHLFAHLSGAK